VYTRRHRKIATAKKRFPKGRKIAVLLVPALVLLAALALSSPASDPEEVSAAPFQSCDTFGILYQYPGNVAPTQVHEIDMVSGADSYTSNPLDIAGRRINAIGYNVKDQFIYGWDHGGSSNLVRVHQHQDPVQVDDLTIDNLPGGYDPTGHSVNTGDVDDKGHYWFIDNTTNEWVKIDLNTSPNPAYLDRGPNTGLTGTAGADMAFIPGTDSLWRIMNDSGDARLWSFNRTSQSWTNHTPVDPLPGISGSDVVMGAFYADPQRHLYGSSNATGNVWRVNIDDPTGPGGTVLFASGSSSNDNDGARCAEAIIPIDFGDAPDSYSTGIADNGPRHGVIGYNNSDHTATFMLGKKLDIETDGFPGADALGDDHNDIDDEEGVQHIVATPGTPTALSVPVTVTNNTSDTATLAGWIDLDSNGTFDTGERVTATIPANSGTGVYTLDFPETTFNANTYARFRVFDPSVTDPQPTGSATGGEVEDYLVQVGTYEVEKTSTPANGTSVSPGDTISYTLHVRNTGLTDLVNLTIHDNLSDVLDDATMEGNPVINPSSAGSAIVNNDELEFVFTGDVLTGQTVAVTYSVKVNDPANLSNNEIRNHVIAAHSNCHPSVEDGQHTAPGDPACQTTHHVAGLANTGSSIVLPLTSAAILVSTSCAIFYIRRNLHQRPLKKWYGT
jgi:fimbrial isopeptide formation D2 family protein